MANAPPWLRQPATMSARAFESAWRGGIRNFAGVVFEGRAPYVTPYQTHWGGWIVALIWYNPALQLGGQAMPEPFEVLERGFIDVDAATDAARRLASVTGLEFRE